MSDFLQLILKLPIALIFLTIFIRFMGHKELQQNTPIDFVYLVMLASMGWDMSLEPKFNALHMFIAMAVLSICIYLMEWLSWKFPFFERYLIGQPAEIIRNGKWNIEHINRERLSQTELDAKLRECGVFNVEEVEVGILEVTGDLTIKRKEE